MFRSFQIIIRDFRRSLLKLLHYCVPHYVAYDAHLANYNLQQIPTQHDMLSQHLVYKNELNREHLITLAKNDETP